MTYDALKAMFLQAASAITIDRHFDHYFIIDIILDCLAVPSSDEFAP